MAFVPKRIIDREGWGLMEGDHINHYYIGTWTACEHKGPVHVDVHLPSRSLPDCVVCDRVIEKRRVKK